MCQGELSRTAPATTNRHTTNGLGIAMTNQVSRTCAGVFVTSLTIAVGTYAVFSASASNSDLDATEAAFAASNEESVEPRVMTSLGLPEAEIEAADLEVEPTPQELGVALHRVGLSAEALATAGVSAAKIPALVSAARTALIANEDALELADAAHASAKQDVARLERVIRAGQEEAGDVAALATARASMGSAAQSQASVLAVIRTAAQEGLSGGEVSKLATLQANDGRTAPAPYLIVDRTDAEWRTLRDLLSIERIALEAGESVPTPVADALADIRSNGAVAAAMTSLAQHGASHLITWRAYVGL